MHRWLHTKHNESFNSTVWALAPKSISSGKTILDVATNIAVCVFNDGLVSIFYVIKAMNLEINPNSYEICLEIDKRRIKLAERSLSDLVKRQESLQDQAEKKCKSRKIIWKANFMVQASQIKGMVKLFIEFLPLKTLNAFISILYFSSWPDS